MEFPAKAFDSRLRGDKVRLGSSPTKSQIKSQHAQKQFLLFLENNPEPAPAGAKKQLSALPNPGRRMLKHWPRPGKAYIPSILKKESINYTKNYWK